MDPHHEQQDPLESGLRQIVQASGNERMSPEEKEALWQRIENDSAVPVRRRIWWNAAAAALVLLIAGGWWMLSLRKTPETDTSSDLLAFAQQQQRTDTVKETKLLLGDQKAVTLQKDNATLAYDKSGVNADGHTYDQEASAYNTLIVPYGRRADITLGDGTRVWLNAGSRIVYPVSFNDRERAVFLEGEAFFDVVGESGRPFQVHTGKMKTTVLGTSFNISAYADDEEQSVVLTSGSVKVKAGDTEQQLVPGNKAAYMISKDQFTKTSVNTQLYTAWKDGHLVLEHEPLPQILKKLSRYFNVRINTATTVKSSFSGDLDLSEDIDYVMQSLSMGTGLTYDKNAEGIVFRKP